MFLERDEMKFAVLYTLKRYVEPASMGQLTEILTWEKEVMGYFELAIILNELIEDGYVEQTHYRDEQAFCLSQKGSDTNDFFFERVPKSIRRRIDEAVGAVKFADQADPNAIKTEVLPVAPYQYMASLQMLDASTSILELKVFAGSRAAADKAVKQLKRQAADIYKDVIARIGGEERPIPGIKESIIQKGSVTNE